jgi:hypothetical protein
VPLQHRRTAPPSIRRARTRQTAPAPQSCLAWACARATSPAPVGGEHRVVGATRKLVGETRARPRPLSELRKAGFIDCHYANRPVALEGAALVFASYRKRSCRDRQKRRARHAAENGDRKHCKDRNETSPVPAQTPSLRRGRRLLKGIAHGHATMNRVADGSGPQRAVGERVDNDVRLNAITDASAVFSPGMFAERRYDRTSGDDGVDATARAGAAYGTDFARITRPAISAGRWRASSLLRETRSAGALKRPVRSKSGSRVPRPGPSG